jgi:hypothetical protein
VILAESQIYSRTVPYRVNIGTRNLSLLLGFIIEMVETQRSKRNNITAIQEVKIPMLLIVWKRVKSAATHPWKVMGGLSRE